MLTKIEYMEEKLEEGEQPLDMDSPKVQKALNRYANAYLIHYQLTNQDAHQFHSLHSQTWPGHLSINSRETLILERFWHLLEHVPRNVHPPRCMLAIVLTAPLC